jgi:hypothetical protein
MNRINNFSIKNSKELIRKNDFIYQWIPILSPWESNLLSNDVSFLLKTFVPIKTYEVFFCQILTNDEFNNNSIQFNLI